MFKGDFKPGRTSRGESSAAREQSSAEQSSASASDKQTLPFFSICSGANALLPLLCLFRVVLVMLTRLFLLLSAWQGVSAVAADWEAKSVVVEAVDAVDVAAVTAAINKTGKKILEGPTVQQDGVAAAADE